MTQIPPTIAKQLERANGTSECCDAPLELSSPPNIYECRECAKTYDLAEDGLGECQEELGNGDICGRDRPCQYHD